MKSVGIGKYGPITVGTAAVKVPFSQNPRETIGIANLGAAIVYLGFDANVTTSTGFPIAATNGFINIDGSMTIWLISGSAGNDVRYIEAG